MVSINITLTHIISFTVGFIYFNIILKILDKKTRTINDNSIILLKFYFLFTLCGILCFPFLKQIREKRKISFYEKQINIYNIMYANDIKNNNICDEVRDEMRNMDIYLKLKKIKRKNKRWLNILETTKK